MTRFALIGCGRIAEKHAMQIARIGVLDAVCDVDKDKAERLAAGAAVYTSIDDLLQQEKAVDVAVICTPNGLHAEHAIKSLQAGRHVLCEKPMCLTSSAAWSMRDTAYFFRKKLLVVKQNRFNPPVLAVKKLLDENALGKILSFSINGFWNRPQQYYKGGWHGDIALDGGILYTQFSHFIDLLLWLLGDVATVKTMRKNWNLRQNFSIEDTAVALLHMQNGALGTAHFSINSFGGNKEGSFSIIGEKGTVKIGGQYLNTLEWIESTNGKQQLENTNSHANDYGFYTGSMSNHHLVYDELQKALNGQAHALPGIQEAVRTVELIEKIYAVSENMDS